MYKHFGSQTEQMIKRLSVVSNAKDLLIKKHSIQKRHLIMASENENVNLAEVITSTSARENYKGVLVSEGQLCDDYNFKCYMNIECLRVRSTACDSWGLLHTSVSQNCSLNSSLAGTAGEALPAQVFTWPSCELVWGTDPSEK